MAADVVVKITGVSAQANVGGAKLAAVPIILIASVFSRFTWNCRETLCSFHIGFPRKEI